MAVKLVLKGLIHRAVRVNYFLNGSKVAMVDEFEKTTCYFEEGGVLVAKDDVNSSPFGNGVNIKNNMETHVGVDSTGHLRIEKESPFYGEIPKKSREGNFRETILVEGMSDPSVKKIIAAMFVIGILALFFFVVLLDGVEEFAWLLMGLGVLMLVLAFLLLISCCGQKMVVTNKRVYAQGWFLGKITIPLDAISAVRIFNWTAGIYITSSSGRKAMCHNITNRDKIYDTVCELLIARQKGNE